MQNDFQEYIFQSLDEIYQRIYQGKDVSPSQQLKLEGQIEMLLHFSQLSYDDVIALIQSLFDKYGLTKVEDSFWQWGRDNQRFYLPIMMQEAPVYKN